MIASTVVVFMYIKYKKKKKKAGQSSDGDDDDEANHPEIVEVTESEVVDNGALFPTVTLDGIHDDDDDDREGSMDNRQPKVRSSWRCNPDEFIVKIE